MSKNAFVFKPVETQGLASLPTARIVEKLSGNPVLPSILIKSGLFRSLAYPDNLVYKNP
jgi:hypothetical protein